MFEMIPDEKLKNIIKIGKTYYKNKRKQIDENYKQNEENINRPTKNS